MDQRPKYLSASFWRPTCILNGGVMERAPGSSAERSREDHRGDQSYFVGRVYRIIAAIVILIQLFSLVAHFA